MNHPLSLAHLVRDRAVTDPDLDVLTFEHEGRTQVRTYGDLWAHALRIADVFSALGVSRSDGCGLLLHNEPEFVESMIAANVLGAVFVPLDPRLRGDRLAFMVGDAGCRGVVCGADAVEAVLSIAPKAPNLEWILVVGSPAPPRPPPSTWPSRRSPGSFVVDLNGAMIGQILPRRATEHRRPAAAGKADLSYLFLPRRGDSGMPPRRARRHSTGSKASFPASRWCSPPRPPTPAPCASRQSWGSLKRSGSGPGTPISGSACGPRYCLPIEPDSSDRRGALDASPYGSSAEKLHRNLNSSGCTQGLRPQEEAGLVLPAKHPLTCGVPKCQLSL